MKNKQNEMDGELVGEPLVYEPPMCICLGTIRDMTKGGHQEQATPVIFNSNKCHRHAFHPSRPSRRVSRMPIRSIYVSRQRNVYHDR